MTTKEMYDQGYRCRGAGFNCRTCSISSSCVEYQYNKEKPWNEGLLETNELINECTKRVKIKNKSCRIKEEPIGMAFVVTNDKFSFFRAFKGQELGPSSKKYVAYIHEIVEEL